MSHGDVAERHQQLAPLERLNCLASSAEAHGLGDQLHAVSLDFVSGSSPGGTPADASHPLYRRSTWGWAAGLSSLQQAASHLGIHAEAWQQAATRAHRNNASQLHLAPLASLMPTSTSSDAACSLTTADTQPLIAGPASSKQRPSTSIALLREVLSASRELLSPHCAAVLAEAAGLAGAFEAGRASALLPRSSEAHLETMRGAIKQHMNGAWSLEAVRQGVVHAKSGQYEEARRCYAKALELQPDNADAYVARGAAFANERNYPAAACDLRSALRLAPDNANAARYLNAVTERARQEGAPLDLPCKTAEGLGEGTDKAEAGTEPTCVGPADTGQTVAAAAETGHRQADGDGGGAGGGVGSGGALEQGRGRSAVAAGCRQGQEGMAGDRDKLQKRRRSTDSSSGETSSSSADHTSCSSPEPAGLGGTSGGSSIKQALQAVLAARRQKGAGKKKGRDSKAKGKSKHKRKDSKGSKGSKSKDRRKKHNHKGH